MGICPMLERYCKDRKPIVPGVDGSTGPELSAQHGGEWQDIRGVIDRRAALSIDVDKRTAKHSIPQLSTVNMTRCYTESSGGCLWSETAPDSIC